MTYRNYISSLPNPFSAAKPPLCGRMWFDEHRYDISQTVIDAQTLTVSNGTVTSILKATYKIKDIKTVLKGIRA